MSSLCLVMVRNLVSGLSLVLAFLLFLLLALFHGAFDVSGMQGCEESSSHHLKEITVSDVETHHTFRLPERVLFPHIDNKR